MNLYVGDVLDVGKSCSSLRSAYAHVYEHIVRIEITRLRLYLGQALCNRDVMWRDIKLLFDTLSEFLKAKVETKYGDVDQTIECFSKRKSTTYFT